MNRKLLITVIILAISVVNVAFSQIKLDIKPNSTVAFLGDSVMAQNLYTSYLEMMLINQYPELNLHFINAGFSGRHIAHLNNTEVLTRDVMQYKPDIIFICFGLNDFWYSPLTTGIENSFRENYVGVLDKIYAASPQCQLILMSPTCVDPMTKMANLKGYNNALTTARNVVGFLAVKYTLSFIDLFSLSQAQVVVQQKITPNFSFYKDGLHPNEYGHYLIAAILANELGLTPLSADFAANVRNMAIERSVNITINQMVGSSNYLNVKANLAKAPLPIPKEAQLARDLKYVFETRNRFAFRAFGLEAGEYHMYYNGRFVGGYTNNELTNGVDIANSGYDAAERFLKLERKRVDLHNNMWKDEEFGIMYMDDNQLNKPKMTEYALATNEFAKTISADMVNFLKNERDVDILVAKISPLKIDVFDVSQFYIFRTDSTKYPPEIEHLAPVPWQKKRIESSGMLSFNREFSAGNIRNSVVYAKVNIRVPKDCYISIGIGSFGPMKIFFDSVPVYTNNLHRVARQNEDIILLNAKSGQHTILFRELRGNDGWGFYPTVNILGLTADERKLVTLN